MTAHVFQIGSGVYMAKCLDTHANGKSWKGPSRTERSFDKALDDRDTHNEEEH